jgi:hypothetical protein
LSIPAADARRAVSDWRPLSTTWGHRQAVKVADVASFGNVAYVVATTTRNQRATPWVQTCTARRCRAAQLPRPGRASTTVTSVSGSERTDVWAVGYTTSGDRHRPVWWHKQGSTWSILDTGIGTGVADIRLMQVEVSNKSKAFATARFRHNEATGATTSTLYRWNGNGWKEVGPVGEDPSVFEAPCDGWYNRNWTDVVARSGSAVLIGTCGAHRKQVVVEQGDSDWTVMTGGGLPDNVTWRTGSLVGQQVWLVGTRNGRSLIYANDAGSWSRISREGLRSKAVVSDLAGVNASKVTAVGWIATGGGHRIASAWRWGGGSWHETEVPAGVSRSQLIAAYVEGDGPVFAVGNDQGRKPPQRALVFRSIG